MVSGAGRLRGNVQDVEGAPTIFTAVEEQLGLTLQPERGLVEVLVIDRVERAEPD